MIHGVKIKQLKVIPDERGRLMEMLRCDDDFFEGFGQVYMTASYPGVVKAWHYHKRRSGNQVVIKGMMKIVLYDDREGSPTKGELNEFFIGEQNQALVHIPPMIYHGFKCISETEAILVNITNEAFNKADPDDYKLPPNTDKIPYNWGRRDG